MRCSGAANSSSELTQMSPCISLEHVLPTHSLLTLLASQAGSPFADSAVCLTYQVQGAQEDDKEVQARLVVWVSRPYSLGTILCPLASLAHQPQLFGRAHMTSIPVCNAVQERCAGLPGGAGRGK